MFIVDKQHFSMLSKEKNLMELSLESQNVNTAVHNINMN